MRASYPSEPTERFVRAIRQRLDEMGLSPYQAAKRANLPSDAINTIFHGRTPSIDKAAAIASALRLDMESVFSLAPPIFLTGDIDDADYARVPRLAVEASAGHGAEVHGEEATAELAFRRDWLRRRGLQRGKLSVIVVRGDSMTPAFADGDAVLVDCRSTKPRRGRVVAAWTEDGLAIKRLEQMDRNWLLTSDNRGYPPAMLAPPARIIGRVVWRGAWVEEAP